MLSFFVVWLMAAVPWFAGFAAMEGHAGWIDWRWPAASLVSAAVVWGAAAIWLYRIAKRRSLDAYVALRKTLLEAGLGCPTVNVLETAHADCRRLYDTIIARHKAQNQKADAAYAEGLARTEARRQRETEQAEAKYPKRLAELTAWRDRALQTIEEKYPPRLSQIEQEFAAQSKQLRVRFRQGHGGGPRAVRAPLERDGRAVAKRHRAVPGDGRRGRAGGRGVSRLEHGRLGPLDAGRRHPGGGSIRLRKGEAGRHPRRPAGRRAAAAVSARSLPCR